jgi:hypothetical protein
MSAPTRSASRSSSFMKRMRVASMTLAAYLVSSALRVSIHSSLSRLREIGAWIAHISSLAHSSSAPIDDHLVVAHVLADAARGGQHVLEIGRTVLVGRRADADELRRPVMHRDDVGGELQPAIGRIALDPLFQTEFSLVSEWRRPS